LGIHAGGRIAVTGTTAGHRCHDDPVLQGQASQIKRLEYFIFVGHYKLRDVADDAYANRRPARDLMKERQGIEGLIF
jgi:hypothetical protein